MVVPQSMVPCISIEGSWQVQMIEAIAPHKTDLVLSWDQPEGEGTPWKANNPQTMRPELDALSKLTRFQVDCGCHVSSFATIVGVCRVWLGFFILSCVFV